MTACSNPLLEFPPSEADHEGEAYENDAREKLRASKLACVRWRAATASAAAASGSTSAWGPGQKLEPGEVPLVHGARAGRVVHAVMERLDLSRPADALIHEGKELTVVLGRQAGIPEGGVLGCQKVIERILSNPLIELARKAPERWHEVPFTYHVKGPQSVISGSIDLCFPVDETRKKWVIFDWKSKVPPKGTKKREQYEEQLERYAKALLKNMADIEIVAKEIVGPHKEIEPFEEKEDVLTEVRPEFKEALAVLLSDDAPEPEVNADIGDAVTLSADLVWEEKKVAVFLEIDEADRAALIKEGWTICASVDAARAALLIAPTPEDDA